MTTLHPDARPAPVESVEASSVAHQRLRGVVEGDAIVCALSGLALLLAAEPLADLAGLATTGPARAVGAFLVLLGVALAGLTAASDRARMRWVPLSAAGDVGWALASLAVAVLADLTGPGRALIAAQGFLALAIGEAKLALRRRAGAER